MKSLLPSFILILLYFIAEEFFGPKIGLIAVIVLGAGEFFYSWIKEKRINKMTLFNTLFFIALAAVSVLLEGTSFERIHYRNHTARHYRLPLNSKKPYTGCYAFYYICSYCILP